MISTFLLFYITD